MSSSVSSDFQYTLPRMKQATNEVSEDLTLFVHATPLGYKLEVTDASRINRDGKRR